MLWDRLVNLGLVCCLSCVIAISFSHVLLAHSTPTYQWELPTWVPKPIVPANNPMTAAKVELGRYLFYERRLSVNGTQSCASCHIQARAFTDGKMLAQGATGEQHPRNSMSLANIAYNSVLNWANPLVTKLEEQGLVPLFGEHPVELGMAGRERQILKLLQTEDRYKSMFQRAFGADRSAINLNNMMKAIASFERSIVSFDSPYDRYRYGGDSRAISAAAKRGEVLFNSESLECFHCHSGFNFSDSTVHARSGFPEIAFHNTGLYNIDGRGAYPPHNSGVYEITHQPKDMGRFKAPTLRNIELTAPYMHDGSVPTLAAAIAHYQAGGRTIASGKSAGVGSANPLKSNFISGFKLTKSEQQDLLAFLNSLTDLHFTQNPAFSDPFQ
jgi:cytochrome c peroxidase